jgi:hypothetical protein
MFGLMRKSTHKKIYTEQGESYRWTIDQQKYEIEALKRNLGILSDSIVPTVFVENQIIHHDRLLLTIEINAERLRRQLPQDILIFVRDRILERLNEFNKDYRPDMRQQVKNERLLIR